MIKHIKFLSCIMVLFCPALYVSVKTEGEFVFKILSGFSTFLVSYGVIMLINMIHENIYGNS